MSVPGPRRAALRRGLAVRLDAAGGGGRPGPLPRAVRARLADQRRCRCCRSGRTWRAPRCARSRALQGRAEHPGTLEEPGKIGHEFRDARAGAASSRRAGRPRARSPTTAPPTRRRGSSCCSRRRGDGALADELAGAWRAAGAWLEGALERGGGFVRFAAGTSGGAQPAGLARRDRPGLRPGQRRDPARRRHRAGVAARRRRHARRRPTRRCARWRGCRARTAGSGSRRSCASASARSARRRWPSSPTARSCPAPAPSSAGCCGRTRSTARRARRPRSGCASPTCSTAFGLRTLSSDSPVFGAGHYHRGSVWPFDSWLGWGGLRAAGRDGGGRARPHGRARRARAARPRARALRGLARRRGVEPVPLANRVQAWTVGRALGARERAGTGGVDPSRRRVDDPPSVTTARAERRPPGAPARPATIRRRRRQRVRRARSTVTSRPRLVVALLPAARACRRA